MDVLFDSPSNKITLGKWDFHEISLDDLERYAEFTQATEYPANLWSSNFAYLWTSSQSRLRKVLWKVVDGMLVTFGHSFRDTLYLFCLPLGEGNPEKLMNVIWKCVQYCYDWNHQENDRTMIRMINHNQLEFLKRCPDFDRLFKSVTLQGIERHLDVKKLVTLSGSDFSTIRNKLHRFQRENPDAVVRRYENRDYQSLMELGKDWDRVAGRKYRRIVDRGYYRGLVEHCEELRQDIWVVQNGETLIGMVAGGELPTGNAWGSLLKYKDGIPGLSEFLSVTFARRIHQLNSGIELINIGSDLGPGGLRDYKLKFRPVLNLKRYQVYMKQG